MARLATAGFERALAASGANVEGLANQVLTGFGTSGSISGPPTARSGTGYMLRSLGKALIGIAFTAVTGRSYYFRFYFKYSPPIFFTNGVAALHGSSSGTYVPIASVRINADGTINLITGTSTVIGSASAALAGDAWHRIELRAKINSGSGADDEVELRLNGTQVAISTTATLGTAWPANPTASIGGDFTPTSAITARFDDLALNDDQGADQNSWPGDGNVVYLAPVADSAKGAGWTNDAGSSTSLFPSVDNDPPTGIADTTSGSGTNQIRNATSNANSAYDAEVTDYTTAGVGATDDIKVVQAVVHTAAPIATGAKAGTVGMVSNPAGTMTNLAAGGTAGAFWQGVAGGAYPTGWKYSVAAPVYNPTVVKGTRPVVRINQVTGSTRIAMVCNLGVIVEYAPAAAPPDIAPKRPVIKRQAVNRAAVM